MAMDVPVMLVALLQVGVMPVCYRDGGKTQNSMGGQCVDLKAVY